MSQNNQSEITEFYNHLYQEKQNMAMRPPRAYEGFLKHLEPLATGKNFLDVACGTGFFLKLAADKGLKTYGIDISSQAVEVAQQNSPSSQVQMAEAENLPFAGGFFDYITCLGSLEHFSDIERSLSEMIRVGKNTTKYLLVVPNKNYFAWWFKKNKGTHQREIGEELKSLNEWRKIFTGSGFKIIKISADRWPTKSLPWFYSYNPLKIFKRLFFKLVWLILPLRYTYQFIFLCQKDIAKM